jgi:hypothetical protein
MSQSDQTLLIAAVAGVGVLHTIVPDHWAPITLLARQHGWSKAQTARAALGAGTGHVVSTLLLGLIVWIAGAATARHVGQIASGVSSTALIAFGAWIAFSSWRELHVHNDGHHHEHPHEMPDRKIPARTTLLLILGSSPMVEGIPAFFAAGRYGAGLVAVMAAVLAVSTIATYVLLCVSSVSGLNQMKLGSFERYGEVISGAFIAMIGIVSFVI